MDSSRRKGAHCTNERAHREWMKNRERIQAWLLVETRGRDDEESSWYKHSC
ncbi:hypothetical protein ACS0TY_030025 [Phlomoides rotata]